MEIMAILEKAESYLSQKSSRERFLLYFLCFIVGFFIVFSVGFEDLRADLVEAKMQKQEQEMEILSIKRDSSEILAEGDKELLMQSILELEQKITAQEAQKRLLGEKFGVYFIAEIADWNHLRDFNIAQNANIIALSASGKFYDVFKFLESMQSQPHLIMQSLSLYPNAKTLSLEFYLELSIRDKNVDS